MLQLSKFVILFSKVGFWHVTRGSASARYKLKVNFHRYFSVLSNFRKFYNFLDTSDLGMKYMEKPKKIPQTSKKINKFLLRPFLSNFSSARPSLDTYLKNFTAIHFNVDLMSSALWDVAFRFYFHMYYLSRLHRQMFEPSSFKIILLW